MHLEDARGDGDVAIGRSEEKSAKAWRGGTGKSERQFDEIREKAGHGCGGDTDVTAGLRGREGVKEGWVEEISLHADAYRAAAGSGERDEKWRALNCARGAIGADHADEIDADRRRGRASGGRFGDNYVLALSKRRSGRERNGRGRRRRG